MTNQIIYKGSLNDFIEEMKFGRHLHEVPTPTVKVWITAFTKSQQHTMQFYIAISGYAADNTPLQLRLRLLEQLKMDRQAREENTKKVAERENEIRGILIEEGFTVFEGSFDPKGETVGYFYSKT